MVDHEKQGVTYPIPTSLFSQMQHLTHSVMKTKMYGWGMQECNPLFLVICLPYVVASEGFALYV